jgi:glutathione peroxidase
MKTVLGMSVVFVGVLLMSERMLSAQAEKAATAAQPAAVATDVKAATPLNVTMKSITGKDVNLSEKYAGKVVLLVNVASKCGNTPQYAQLQALHDKYAEKGLAIVGVPCNQFRSQEPGSDADILAFCTETYGVKFDMLSKVDVNGANACELYKFLTSKEKNPKFGGDIPWNFEKFLFSRDGQVAGRFFHRTKPDAEDVVKTIEAELAKKAPAKPSDTKAQPAAVPGAPSN